MWWKYDICSMETLSCLFGTNLTNDVKNGGMGGDIDFFYFISLFNLTITFYQFQLILILSMQNTTSI